MKRLAYLDSLRGVAALVVAGFWHYQHFALGYQPSGYPFEAAPGYNLQPLSLFYHYGFLGVDFFFILSGIVFSYVYLNRISKREIGPKEFWRRRFARLYPLHLATLLATAGLIWFFWGWAGRR